jgi:Uma2 family endonuclease
MVLTYAQYLAAEETSSEKHDYLDGERFAMSRGSLEHSALAATCARLLGSALTGRPCIVFDSNARVRRVQTNFSCYPDVTVVCGAVESGPDDPQSIVNPIVIVEVLSESTESYDRGEKSRHYRGMTSLRELVFISQSRRLVEVLRRNATGRFELFEWVDGEVELQSIAVHVPVSALYLDAEVIAGQRRPA